jgi:hypothetical protein
MPISEEAARAERIRQVAEILASGLDRLFKSHESQRESRRDALSFPDRSGSVSEVPVNGNREPLSWRHA